ncbi:MAG TPA: CoA ester lyase, partial [Gammaproteobacteria bacterium]|nr:CoA ester lyase [Gammaproteobacteria bacterium]
TELLAAFEEHESSGKMAFTFNGAMVDVPHLKRAKQVLATAAKLSGKTI